MWMYVIHALQKENKGHLRSATKELKYVTQIAHMRIKLEMQTCT